MPEGVIEDPVLRQRLRFSRSAAENGDEVLHVEVWVQPGGGVTPHIHPTMEERFEVLEGNVSFLAGKAWQTSGPGETAVVPPGTRHAYRNRGSEEAHMVCHATPPESLQSFLEDATALGRSGKTTRHAIPKSPSGLLQAVVLAHHHREMVTLLFPPLPPPAIQRIVIPPLARFAERRGYRASEERT